MKEIKIGRSNSNDIVINDPIVSGKHAVIRMSDIGEVTIQDLGSTNGTFVDGERISVARLTAASVVVLGNHTIDWKEIMAESGNKQPQQVQIPANAVSIKTIGRNPAAQIKVLEDEVSDKHAFICKLADGSTMLIDNHSTNGTFVNGQRIYESVRLNPGDQIRLVNKYPVEWEEKPVETKKRGAKKPLIISLIAMAAVAVVAMIVVLAVDPFTWRSKKPQKIYAEHKYDVVWVYVKSTFKVMADGQPISKSLPSDAPNFDYLSMDREGEIDGGENSIMHSSGTGFFISQDGKLLTNRHVAEGVYSAEEVGEREEYIKEGMKEVLRQAGYYRLAQRVEVKYTVLSIAIAKNDTHLSSEQELTRCATIAMSQDDNLDIALLQTNTKALIDGCTYVDLTKVATDKTLEIGDPIYTIGFPASFIIGITPEGLEANNQSGEVTQARGRYEYGHNITIQHGASGSPVYDNKGHFAGVIVSGFLGVSQGYNQAIAPAPVIEFVNKY